MDIHAGFIDLVEIFKHYSKKKLKVMYIPADGHWTRFGTKACAEEIYRYLLSEDRLPHGDVQ